MLIFEKITKVMADINPIAKNRKNVGQNYAFRGIDDVMNELNKSLIKHDVVIIPKVLNIKREERQSKSGSILIWSILTVEYTFFTSDGSNVKCVVKGEGMDSGDKSINKALSAAFKYACLQVFCIPTEEKKDSEYDSPEITSAPTQKKKQKKSIPDNNTKEKYMNVSKVMAQSVWKKDIFDLVKEVQPKLSVQQLNYFNVVTTEEYYYPEKDYLRDKKNLENLLDREEIKPKKASKPEIEDNEIVPEFNEDFNQEDLELPKGVM